MRRRLPWPAAASALLVTALLGACATPVFDSARHTVGVAPSDVQAQGADYSGREILWGGRIVRVQNHEHATEVEVISYPLDRERQPRTDLPTQGRFLLMLPGFAEPYDYQAGRHLTVHGVLAGMRSGRIQDHEYIYPLVNARAVHVWPWGFMFDKRPQISIGIGAHIH